MKRREALSEIKHCGYIGDPSQAGLITAQKGISISVSKKMYLAGEKVRRDGFPCDCTACIAKRGKK